MDRPTQGAILESSSFWNQHRQWLDSLEYYNPLTYEFQESEASRRVSGVARRHWELLEEWRAGAGADGYNRRIVVEWAERCWQRLWSAEEAGMDLSTVTVQSIEAEVSMAPAGAEIIRIAQRTRGAGQASLEDSRKTGDIVPFPQPSEARWRDPRPA